MLERIFPKYVNGKNIVFMIIAILFVIFIIKISDIAILFFASFVIACSLETLVQKIMKIFPKIDRNTACALSLTGSIFLILALFIPIIIIGGNQIRTFAASFPQYIDTIKSFLQNQSNIMQIDFGGMSAPTLSTDIVGNTINFGKNLGSGLIYLIISFLLIYYFMSDKETVKKTVLKMFPTNLRNKTSDIYDTIFKKIGGYVIAQIATMASVGIIVTIGLLILRVDYALLLGLIASVFDLIPVVGPMIAFVICIIATWKYGWMIVLMTAVIFGVAQLIENNFVRPYVFSKFLNLHPLMVFLFLLICAKFMGVIGMLFAPAIAATFVVLIEDVYMKSIEQDN